MSETLQQSRLRLLSDPGRFRGARRWLARLLGGAGWSDDESHDLAVALTEVCSNVHRHAYGGSTAGLIDLILEVDRDRTTLTVRHYGARFDAGSYRPPDLERPREGGYGIYLIDRLCDRVEYRELDVGCQVELRKSRRPKPGDEDQEKRTDHER